MVLIGQNFMKNKEVKNMKPKRVLKKWVKYSLLVIAIIPVMILLMNINEDLEKDFLNKCESQGYSHNYCISNS